MKFAPLILIFVGSILEIFDGTLAFFADVIFKEGFVPDEINLPSLGIQVSLFLLAIIFSTINLLKDKPNKIVHFCTLLASTSLFLARLTWLINNIRWSYF